MHHLLVIALLIASLSTTHAANVPDVQVDWPSFLARHDLLWDQLPDKFDYGAFLGNGLLGATIYREGDRKLRWEMGRADVTEHRRDNSRLPIGGLLLETVGRIKSGTMRLDLWNAEVTGEFQTDRGTVRFRSLVHTREMVLVTDLETTGDENGANFSWQATPCVEYVCAERFKDDLPNPPSRLETIAGLPVCVQSRFAGGAFATAWSEQRLPSTRRIILSIADSFPGTGAAAESAQTVTANVAADFSSLLKSHRSWWHAFYPQSFVSIPDHRLESFYWIQWYKFACASRPGSPPTDLLGPWFRKTAWPRIWWDLNIEVLYSPVYTGNRLMLGESLVGFFDTKWESFFRNARERWTTDNLNKTGAPFDDCAYVPVTTDNQGLRGDGVRAPDLPNRGYWTSPGHLTWALQDYYLHYRYSMDHTLVTDHKTHAFYPLLRANINTFLRLLQKGDDGKLHMPGNFQSPEYFRTGPDSTYSLALFHWGCQTLLELDRRYQFHDPLATQWQEALDKLSSYPIDENGFCIAAGVPFTKSHRHWSHLFMVYPLHILDLQSPPNRELVNRTINHWLTTDGAREVYGWSHAAAASLRAAMGDGDLALDHVQAHLADKRFIRPNTMYIEGSPVIECSIFLNQSLHDMLLQSWNGTISIFPAMPAVWKDTVFHDLRAEGAFLVSARRQAGRTTWVRIRSLAGEPCRVRPGFSGPFTTTVDGKAITPKDAGDGAWELPLAKGEEALLVADPGVSLRIEPLPMTESEANPWGLRARKSGPEALSMGKAVRASSIWSKELDATKAVDGDESTRWGAANGSRSGWLEVDLGVPTCIGRVVVKELSHPRIEQFAIEWKDGDDWKPLATGTTLGDMTLDFPPVMARVVRVNIIKANEAPILEEFQVFPPVVK